SASGLMCCKARVRAARVPRGFARTGSAANDSGFVEGDGIGPSRVIPAAWGKLGEVKLTAD
ncbi:unnamed protein product, partial [Durusdinium trenchii]